MMPDSCPSLPLDLPEDVDLAIAAWSHCMFAGTDVEILEASELFSSGMSYLGDLESQSSSSSSTLSNYCPTPPISTCTEPHSSPNPVTSEVGASPVGSTSTDASCASEIPSPVSEGGAWVKVESMDDKTESLDCALTISEELVDQGNSSLMPIFYQDFNCDDRLTFQPNQDGNMDDLLQLYSDEFGDPDPPAVSSVFPIVNYQDMTQNIGSSWPAAISSSSVLPCSPQEMPDLVAESHSESILQELTRWLKNNSNCFSLEELQKIKLKNSTIENATQHLGGGKKGMSHLLKLILIWAQNNYLQHQQLVNDTSAENDNENRLLNSCLCTSSDIDIGISKRDNLSLPSLLDNAHNEETDFSAPMQSKSEYFSRSMSENPGGSGIDSSTSLQTMNEACLNSQLSPCISSESIDEPVSTSYACSMRSINPENFTQVQNSSVLGQFSRSKPPGSSVPSNCFNTSLHHLNHTSQEPKTFLQISHHNPWHASTVQKNTAMPERTFESSIMEGQSVKPSSQMVPYESLDIRPTTLAATTRAARRNRMAKQRRTMRRAHAWPSRAVNQVSWSGQVLGFPQQTMPYSSQGCNSLTPAIGQDRQGKKFERNMRLLLQKQLKQSDVGNLGRIVLPKKDAESKLPYLLARDGINLTVEDWSSSKVWSMRYRFWPNNNSRMYLLENTGNFVKSHHLREGDYMLLYSDTSNGKYMIQGIRIPRLDVSSAATQKDP